MKANQLAHRAAVAEAAAQIWRASTDPARWPEALGAMRELFPRTVGGTLYTPFLQGSPGSLWVNLNPPKGLIEIYLERFATKDLVLHSLLRRLPAEAFVFDELGALSEDVLKSSEVYRDWMAPFGVSKAIGATVHATGQEATLISMAGPGWGKQESARYWRTMEELQPHLHGAIAAHWRLVRAETQAKITRYALDELSLGIAWLGKNGEVLEANRTARVLFDSRDGLQLAGGRMKAGGAQEARRLEAAIAALANGLSTALASKHEHADMVISISRPSGKASYVVSLVPAVADPTGLADHRVRVLAFVSDPARLPARLRSRLMELYGLTRSEAEVAEELARGSSIEDLAGQRGVSVNTARTQVKSLMGKLGASRQSDVIRAVMTLGTLGGHDGGHTPDG